MTSEYSSAELLHRRSVRRSMFAAMLCAVSFSALMAREGSASRQPPAPITLPIDEVADEVSGALSALSGADALQADVGMQQAAAEPIEAMPQASEWITAQVKPGETISTLIESQGMLKYEWMELMALGKSVARLRSLRAGDKLLLRKDAEGKLAELEFEVDATHTLHVQRTDDQLEAYTLAAELERRTVQTSGVIQSSLFADGAKAGLSSQMIMDLAEIFGYDIDFALDLRDGDRFAVVYEALYKNGTKLRDGKILAAEFVNQGQAYRAMRHVEPSGQVAYYSPTGQALRKVFFRTPLDVVRVSSGFNLARRHPILNIIRAHKGVDYAAVTGTPVKATSDASVAFAGVKGGYGNVIILQHGDRYTTLYGHLSRFRAGLRVGMRVNRGQVIGFVGHSGLATAAHLHYEFRINGVHVNPMSATVPRAIGLPKSEVAKWRGQNAQVLAQLDTLSSSRVALAGSGKAARRTR